MQTSLKHTLILAILVLSMLGILDAGYLTLEHYSDALPSCSVSIWVDCGRVLDSEYAVIAGIPVALLGLLFYSSMLGLALMRLTVEKQVWSIKDFLWSLVEKYVNRTWTLERILFYLQLTLAGIAGLVSTGLIYVQVGIIGSICLYCMFSALLSYTMLTVTLIEYFKIVRKHEQLPFPSDRG